MMYIDENASRFTLTKYAKLLILFTGIIAGFIIARIFFIMPFIVQDNSMNPNLKKGDYTLILKITSPKEGDTILLKSYADPGAVILKRLIAAGEKTIEIKNKKIFVDNKELRPAWVQLSNDKRVFPEKFSNRDNLPQVKIKKGELFIIGDNRDYSFDSRDFGPVNERLVIGRMIYKF